MNNLLFRLKGGHPVAHKIANAIPTPLLESGVFYDPSMGGGQYLQAIVDRYKLEYNGDIDSRIYGTETSIIHINWVKRNTQLTNIKKVPSYSIDMKVDAIISNFPFSDRSVVKGASGGGKAVDIDSHLYMESIKNAKYVSAILRSKHFANENSVFRRNLFATGKIVSMEVLPKETFPTILNTETCIVTWDETHTGPTTLIYEDGTVVKKELTKDCVIKFNNPDYVPVVPNNMAHRWMSGSIARNTIVDVDAGVEIIEIMGRKNQPVVTRTIDPTQTNTGCNKHGVVMNLNADWVGFGKMAVKPYESAISKQIIMIETSSHEESLAMLEYLSSDVVSKKATSLKRSFCNSKYVFKMIEDMPNG
jgi:hypothetical protein